MFAQCLHSAFILVTISISIVAGSLTLQVDGRMDFGPKWNYEYRIKPMETSSVRPYITAMDRPGVQESGPKMIDIIIKNNKSNPRLVQVAEARIYDKNNLRNRNETVVVVDEIDIKLDKGSEETNKKQEVNVYHKNKRHKSIPLIYSDESLTKTDQINFTKVPSTANPLIKTDKNIHVIGQRSEEFIGSPLLVSNEKYYDKGSFNKATVMGPQKSQRKRKRSTKRPESKNYERDITKNFNKDIEPNKSMTSRDKSETLKNESKTDVRKLQENVTSEQNITKDRIKVEDFPKQVTEMIETFNITDMYVKPRRVRDDPKIKEFTKHIYEQSLKTFEAIKQKLNNYEIKKEADYLMRGYEEKFGDFVRETQNQKIRTRLGSEKVILNTVDTSNRILERLVNHLIGKMDNKGVLRNAGTENVILNELNKKKELENKHICSKMQICRSSDSLSNFLIDILTIILSADDKKVIEMRDASTEVLKNTDFSTILDPDTEKRFQKGINDLEKYNVALIRPIFNMIKNILASRNTPIKVVGPEDYRVNKTVAFLEMINNFDKKLPPNEKNILEWNDMRNSFKEWKDNKRNDNVELVQHLTDHMLSAELRINDGTMFDRNINTILGF